MTALTPIELVRFLQRRRFDLSSEKHLQQEIAQAFDADGIAYERERRLSASDIPDFIIGDGIAVECKMLNKVESLIDTTDVNEWESGFLKSMMTKSEAGVDLSTKEFAIVERIHNKHFA